MHRLEAPVWRVISRDDDDDDDARLHHALNRLFQDQL